MLYSSLKSAEGGAQVCLPHHDQSIAKATMLDTYEIVMCCGRGERDYPSSDRFNHFRCFGLLPLFLPGAKLDSGAWEVVPPDWH